MCAKEFVCMQEKVCVCAGEGVCVVITQCIHYTNLVLYL